MHDTNAYTTRMSRWKKSRERENERDADCSWVEEAGDESWRGERGGISIQQVSFKPAQLPIHASQKSQVFSQWREAGERKTLDCLSTVCNSGILLTFKGY